MKQQGFIITDKFFKNFKFLSEFFQCSSSEQVHIKNLLSKHFLKDEWQLATFLGDEKQISLFVLWIGKEFCKWTYKLSSLKSTFKALNNKFRSSNNNNSDIKILKNRLVI